MTDDRLTKVLEAGNPGSRHSSLYLFMWENHTTLAADFKVNGPQWKTRVVAMGEAGLRDAIGNVPSERTSMQTWYRVCRKKRSSLPLLPTPTAYKPPEPVQYRPPLIEAVDDCEEVILSGGCGEIQKTVRVPKNR